MKKKTLKKKALSFRKGISDAVLRYKFLQGEMQQLKDKLAVAERTAKSEAELKEKYQLRFKVLEERLKPYPNGTSRTTPEAKSTTSRRQSLGGSENLSKYSQCGPVRHNSAVALLRRAKNSSRSLDDDVSKKSTVRDERVLNGSEKDNGENGKMIEKTRGDNGDYVCGVLYDMLQKEVMSLRKVCHEKDQNLKDKDDAIEILGKKVETLNKAMEVESKKMRREMSLMEKELNSLRSKDQNGARTLLPRNGSHRHY